MYGIVLKEINLAAVFGVFLGFYLLLNVEQVVADGVTFVKGWKS